MIRAQKSVNVLGDVIAQRKRQKIEPQKVLLASVDGNINRAQNYC